MKKLILSAVLAGLFIIPATNVSAQETEKKETSHWSFGIRGGATYYRVSPNAGWWVRGTDAYLENMSWGAGAVLEYSINPLWGIGLSADWLNYNRGNDGDVLGRTLDFGAFGSVNLLNLLSPERKGWRRGGLYFNLGGGYATYKVDITRPGLPEIHLDKDNHGLFSIIGLNAEVPLGNTFALFAEGQYRRYATWDSNLGGLTSHKEDAFYANLGLRVKFRAHSRNHVRNMMPYRDQDAIDALRQDLNQVKTDAAKTAADVNALGNRVNDEVERLKAEDRRLQGEIDALKRALRDLDNQPSQPIVMHNIQFRFDSAVLTAASIAIIEQAARELNANTTWNKLTVSGHTDSIGPNDVNQRLSVARAEAVKRELVRLGIPANKIETAGFGATKPIATNDTAEGRQQNRRVEFQLSK